MTEHVPMALGFIVAVVVLVVVAVAWYLTDKQEQKWMDDWRAAHPRLTDRQQAFRTNVRTNYVADDDKKSNKCLNCGCHPAADLSPAR